MKTKRFSQLRSQVLMAACAALFAGALSSCSKEAPAGEEPLSDKWNVCIPAALDLNPDTRAVVYDENNDKLTAEFRRTDFIYVFKDGVVDYHTLIPDDNGPRANLVGELEGTYKEGDELILAYNTNKNGAFSFAKQTGGHVKNGELDAFDYAVAKVTVTEASEGTVTTTPALFRSLQSMYKFTFVDKKGDLVKVTKLLVSTKSGDLITTTDVFGTTVNKGAVTVDVANGVDAIADGVVWVALSKAGTDADTFIFDALDNDNNLYMGTLDVKSDVIQNGKFYTATITLTKQETDPLTLEAIEAGTITIKNPLGLVISCLKNLDTRVTSLEGDKGDIEIAVTKGDVVRFYGDNATYAIGYQTNQYTNIRCDGACYIYGNIMSLISADDFASKTELTGSYTFCLLFEDNRHIQNHKDKALTLPATTLADCCYSWMFFGCSSLTSAPELPATTLTNGCYQLMFVNCTSLTTAPVLSATTLAKGCYSAMFNGCIQLRKAPKLPATTLAESCYSSMFFGCIQLRKAPELPATTLAESCYSGMFFGCVSLSKAPELPATTLVARCYERMFFSCTSLEDVTCLATDISADGCTDNWLNGVASEGTFTKAASMTGWESGDSGIPAGWSIANY